MPQAQLAKQFVYHSFLQKDYFTRMRGLPTVMYLTVCTPGAVGFSGTQVLGGCEVPCRWRELNLGPLEELPVLLTIELFLQSLYINSSDVTDNQSYGIAESV